MLHDDNWKHDVASFVGLVTSPCLALFLNHLFSAIVLGSEIREHTYYLILLAVIILTCCGYYSYVGIKKYAKVILLYTLFWLFFVSTLKFLGLVFSSNSQDTSEITSLTAWLIVGISCLGAFLSYHMLCRLKENDT